MAQKILKYLHRELGIKKGQHFQFSSHWDFQVDDEAYINNNPKFIWQTLNLLKRTRKIKLYKKGTNRFQVSQPSEYILKV